MRPGRAPVTNRRAAEVHRKLDAAQAEAMARDGNGLVKHHGALMQPRDRRMDMKTMDRPNRPKVLLLRLSQRTSGKGNVYLSGWMGAARLVGFRGEDDENGNPVWELFAAEPEPRGERPAPGRGSAA